MIMLMLSLLTISVQATRFELQNIEVPSPYVVNLKQQNVPRSNFKPASDALETSKQSSNQNGLVSKLMQLVNWKAYLEKFKKHYKTLTEQLVHFKAFLARSTRIAASNLAYLSGRATYYLSINPFTDWTRGQRLKLLQMHIQHDDFKSKPVQSRPKRAVDQTRDGPDTQQDSSTGSSLHVESGARSDSKIASEYQNLDTTTRISVEASSAQANAVKKFFQPVINMVKKQIQGHGSEGTDWQNVLPKCLNEPSLDQGECNSCYAFSIIRLLEWLHCRQLGRSDGWLWSFKQQRLRFSEQYLVDCGHLVGLNGCSGGSIKNVLEFVEQHGILPSHLMPYLGQKQTECKLDIDQSKHLIFVQPVEYEFLRNISSWQLQLVEQPLIVYLRLNEEFLDYGGGIYQYNECEPEFGHYLLLIGHAMLQSSGGDNGARLESVWRMSNSFGPNWGESGYIRMSNLTEHCVGYAIKIRAQFEV